MLSTVYHLTLNGWADRINDVPRIARHFWGARDELSIEEGILLKGHNMHLGIEKMQHRARATLYWPGMDADITEYIKSCKTCTQHKTTQHTQLMIPRDVPEALCQDLTAEFFKFKNNEYLLITDTFSKYPFTFKISTKTADTVIWKFTHLFSHYGTPKCVTNDNGPPFAS